MPMVHPPPLDPEDQEILEKSKRYHSLASSFLSCYGQSSYMEADVKFLASMLFVLDLARTGKQIVPQNSNPIKTDNKLAIQIIHLLGSDVAACERHAKQITALAQGMGLTVSGTPCAGPTICLNCMNEALAVKLYSPPEL